MTKKFGFDVVGVSIFVIALIVAGVLAFFDGRDVIVTGQITSHYVSSGGKAVRTEYIIDVDGQQFEVSEDAYKATKVGDMVEVTRKDGQVSVVRK